MIAGVLAAFALACTTPGPVERPESSLNCLTLFPTPDLAASGSIALQPVASPFGIAATVDGRPRYHLVADIAGLPDPQSLGAYSAYVAWGYTLGLDSAVKLGAVRNGRVDLGELDYVQFRILITAERSSDVRSRSGRLVLRGTSPSARLLAHRDLTTPVTPGVLREAAVSTPAAMAGTGHSMEHSAMSSSVRWRMAPMPPRMAMMPGMSGLSPNTPPYLPASAATRDPSRTIRLRDGDTVNLTPFAFTTTMKGKLVIMLGYNGMLPGPRLEVPQDARITARVRNALDAATSIHWHGIRLDNAFDGAVGLTQAAIEPRGSFGYSVRFPDAGFYWYHPHAREDLQQGLGLYGTIIVRSPNADYYNSVNREETLVLSDILMDERGLIPFGGGVATHALMGRVGNVLLVNGETRYSLTVDRGAVVRFFIANATNARFYNLSFSDPRVRMKVVASDAGKFEHDAFVESVVIGP